MSITITYRKPITAPNNTSLTQHSKIILSFSLYESSPRIAKAQNTSRTNTQFWNFNCCFGLCQATANSHEIHSGTTKIWWVLIIIHTWDKLEVTSDVGIKLFCVFSSTFKTIWAWVSLTLLRLFQRREQFTLICALFTQSSLKMNLWLRIRWVPSFSISGVSKAKGRDFYLNVFACAHLLTSEQSEAEKRGQVVMLSKLSK